MPYIAENTISSENEANSLYLGLILFGQLMAILN